MKSLRAKVFAGFGLLLLIMLLSMSFIYYQMRQFTPQIENMKTELTRLIDDERLNNLVAQRLALSRGYILTGDPDYKTRFEKNVTDSNQIQSHILNGEHSKKIETLIQNNMTLRNLIETDVFTPMEQGNMDQAKLVLLNKVTPLADETSLGLNALALDREHNVGIVIEQLLQRESNLLYLLLAVGGVAVVTGLLVAYILASRIVKPILQIAGRIHSIAKGNLRHEELAINTKDEIGQLTVSTNHMLLNLRSLIQQTTDSTALIAASSEELSASAEQTIQATEQVAEVTEGLAAGSEKQVHSVNGSLQALSEMADGIKSVAVRASRVSESSAEANSRADQGQKAIQTVVAKMHSIQSTVDTLSLGIHGLGERSNEIGQIVETITNLSSQTNLLALNAAIEAARAGEQGRGFAVVADEVRKLAELSTQSAKEIAQLVAAIQQETELAVQSMSRGKQEVEEGIATVDETGKFFLLIQQSIRQVGIQIKEVSSASQQMTERADEVSASALAIKNVTEQAAYGTQHVAAATEEQLASMQEITASAAALGKLADELKMQIDQFEI